MPLFRAEDLSAWCGGRWSPPPAEAIRAVGTDTRSLASGSLYVALRGERFDGHAFLEEAFRRGAAAALVDSPVSMPPSPSRPLLVVDDTRPALLQLAAGYRATLPMRRLGITGSVGKTTVKEMVADLLGTVGPTVRSKGNWNNDIGLPLSLLSAEPETKWGVFEIAMNRPGEIAALSAVLAPEWGVITTIGAVHLEAFPSVEAIAREKAEMARALPEDGRVFLNRDDEWVDLLRRAARCPATEVSLVGEADFQVEALEAATGAFTVRERVSGDRVNLRVPLPGRHMIGNALLAVAVARTAGVPWERLVPALAGYKPPALRWAREPVGDWLVVNDAYNANPISMRAAADAFALMPVAGRRWLVLGGMLELGATEEEEHRSLGRYLATGPWAGLVGVGPRGAWIADGAHEASRNAWPVGRCADPAAAAAWVRAQLRPGDAVLLKASRGEKLERVLDELKQRAG